MVLQTLNDLSLLWKKKATLPFLIEGIGVGCPVQFIVYVDPQVPVAVHSVYLSSQVKSSQIYLYSTFHVQNNSKYFTEIKALQQGAEKALKICKIIEII